jgi:hypothetical protein
VLQNPNFPVHLLQYFSSDYPEHIEKNPILGMLAIENPGLYADLLDDLNQGWISSIYERLDLPTRIKIALICAWRVLPLYERHMGDDIMRDLLLAGRDALNQAEELRLRHAEESANQHINSIPEETPPYSALLAALYAVRGDADGGASGNAPSMDWVNEAIFYDAEDRQEGKELCAEERAFQASLIRAAWKQKERMRLYNDVMKQVEANIKDQAKTKAQIKKATNQAKKSADEIAAIMQREEPSTWPVWLGLGIAGGAVVLLLGPALLAGGVGVGVGSAVAEIVTAAELTGATGISVQAFINGAEILTAPRAAVFLSELTGKLGPAGIVIVKEAVQAVAKVAR